MVEKLPDAMVHCIGAKGGTGGDDGGAGGSGHRGPQSPQSVPYSHSEYAAPSPPSSQYEVATQVSSHKSHGGDGEGRRGGGEGEGHSSYSGT